jgi:hypothetical protein
MAREQRVDGAAPLDEYGGARRFVEDLLRAPGEWQERFGIDRMPRRRIAVEDGAHPAALVDFRLRWIYK